VVHNVLDEIVDQFFAHQKRFSFRILHSRIHLFLVKCRHRLLDETIAMSSHIVGLTRCSWVSISLPCSSNLVPEWVLLLSCIHAYLLPLFATTLKPSGILCPSNSSSFRASLQPVFVYTKSNGRLNSSACEERFKCSQSNTQLESLPLISFLTAIRQISPPSRRTTVYKKEFITHRCVHRR
jgi:hypothetical protein